MSLNLFIFVLDFKKFSVDFIKRFGAISKTNSSQLVKIFLYELDFV